MLLKIQFMVNHHPTTEMTQKTKTIWTCLAAQSNGTFISHASTKDKCLIVMCTEDLIKWSVY